MSEHPVRVMVCDGCGLVFQELATYRPSFSQLDRQCPRCLAVGMKPAPDARQIAEGVAFVSQERPEPQP